MRVALDITPLLDTPTGVGVFTREVATRLAGRTDVELVAYATSWRGRARVRSAAPPGAEVSTRAMPARPLRAVWKRVDWPPIEWFTGRVDVVHGSNFVVPPARAAARVVTVHDLTCIRFPELCTADTLEYPTLLRRALASGAWVHAVSDFVGAEVVELLGADPDTVVVIPNGFGAAPPAWGEPGEDYGADRERAERLAGGFPYILALSTVEPRKDLPTLVAAFAHLAPAHPDLRLVIAGPDGWGRAALDDSVERCPGPVRNRIVRVGWLDDGDRQALLRSAAVLAYPSIYEGFGLPPLEAMAVGTPVVAARAGALPETTGEAALLVTPGDADALAGALLRVLTDPELADRLRANGRANIDRYSWDSTADQLVGLYRQIAGGGAQ